MSRISSIITNTVTWFVQARDRTKIRVKRDDLDTLTEVWTGPSGYEDTFVPPFGKVHPQYNLMTVLSTNTRRLEAGMAEITINYHGKLANAGSDGYSSVPTVNKYWLEGEVSYQVSGSAGYSTVVQTGTGPLLFNFTQVGISTYSRRYTGRCVELAYITNRVPSGQPSNIGLAEGFMGFQNVWDTMTGFSPGQELSGGGQPIWQMSCTDVKVEDSADGWYHVTETYQSRMYPGAAGYAHPPPQFIFSTRIVDAPVSNDSSSGSDGQNQNVISFDGGNTTGAAQATASAGGYDLQGSFQNTAGAGNYYELGMDSSWGGSSDTASDTYSAASDAASGTDSGSGTNAVESTPYDG